MNLLIINQHTYNHGDEAAEKALVRSLLLANPDMHLSILYRMLILSREIISTAMFFSKTIDRFSSVRIGLFEKIVIIGTFVLPFIVAEKLILMSRLREDALLIKGADKVINAPSGVNIGAYKDWLYLWRIFVALKYRKPTAIYSISFGPLFRSGLFSHVSRYVLKKVDFLSLRDGTSQSYAREEGIKCFPATDTAFLDRHIEQSLPKELGFLEQVKYVVIVPHELYKWHPSFRKIDKGELDNLFEQVINYFIGLGLLVVLLPQTFYDEINDELYFTTLKKNCSNPKKVRVIPSSFDSDVQQRIIRKAEFLVGARYHSIVFSIRNETPFFALSYEHKIAGMLSLLSLGDYCYNLLDFAKDASVCSVISRISAAYSERDAIRSKVRSSKIKAEEIARETFQCFLRKFLTS